MCILKQINVSGPEKGDVNGSIRMQRNLFSIRAGLSEKHGSVKVRHERSACGLSRPKVNLPGCSPTAHFLIRSPSLPGTQTLAGTQTRSLFLALFGFFHVGKDNLFKLVFHGAH